MTGAAATLAAARDYIALGWPVFILSPGKKPIANCGPCRARHVTPDAMEGCGCLSCHGFYAASVDPGRVAEMTRQHPRGLLAVRTGAPSGLAVVDVDAPAGLPVMRQLAEDGLLPSTVTQRTGGGGYHMLYRHPGGRIPSVPGGGGDHVDIKADGGYIVVSPSIHPRTGQPYEWLTPADGRLAPLPDSWPARLRPVRALPARPAGPVTRPGAYGAAALERELATVTEAHPGTRNAALNKAGFALFRLAGGGVLHEDTVTAGLWEAAAACGLAAEDAGATRRTIASARRAGLASPRGRSA